MDKPLTLEQQDLVTQNHNLIYFVLHKYKWSVDEYYGTAAIGLCKAAQTFDKEKSLFATYAIKCIYNQILMDLRKNPIEKMMYITALEEPLPEQPALTYADVLQDEKTTPEDQSVLNHALTHIRKKTAYQKEIIAMLHQGYNQDEIAQTLHITQSYVSRLIKQIKEQLNYAYP